MATGAALASLDVMVGGIYPLVARSNRSFSQERHANLFGLVLFAGAGSIVKATILLIDLPRMAYWPPQGQYELLLVLDIASSSADLALALFCFKAIKANFSTSEDNHSGLFHAALDYCKVVFSKGIIILPLSFGVRRLIPWDPGP